jgi:hypothetical protein
MALLTAALVSYYNYRNVVSTSNILVDTCRSVGCERVKSERVNFCEYCAYFCESQRGLRPRRRLPIGFLPSLRSGSPLLMMRCCRLPYKQCTLLAKPRSPYTLSLIHCYLLETQPTVIFVWGHFELIVSGSASGVKRQRLSLGDQLPQPGRNCRAARVREREGDDCYQSDGR